MSASSRRGAAGGDESPGGRVAVLERRGRFLSASPLFERGRPVSIDGSGTRGRGERLGPGDLVLLPSSRPGPPGRGRGRGGPGRVRRIGRADVARDVLEGLMLERGLRRAFDPAVERAARLAEPAEHPRRDLRDLATFTIDPAAARDFDDAISAERLGPGAWRIWVHIADVAAHVPAGSLVDREAMRRATSVYVPGAVEPMLPAVLSNGACSLVPGQERLAVSVEMDLEGARVTRAAFFRSRIRSDARLSYDEVDELFAGRREFEEPWATPLAVAREAAAALQGARDQRGALTVDSAEPEFSFDDAGHVTGMEGVPQTESHRLIEHLMIAANEQVARLLDERSAPALYRVHERPDPPRIVVLADQLASLDVPTPPIPEQLTPQQAAELAGELSRSVDEHVRRTGQGRLALTSLVLRALKQAFYSPVNLGHSGLGSARYCHFTSPIRRYPDLVCHRSLLAVVGGGEEEPARGRLDELGVWTSARERDAMSIERAADDVARCFLLERALFEAGWDATWDGEVVGVISAGAFVRFGDGYEGMVPVRRMRGDWWELNEPGTILFGTRSGSTLRLGDPISVRVDRVDAPRGRVDLVPLDL